MVLLDVSGTILYEREHRTSILTWLRRNLPVGAFSALAAVLFFDSPAKKEILRVGTTEKIRQMDLSGAMVLISSVVCLFLALEWGGSTLPWNAPRIIGLFVGFGLLLLVFIAMQVRAGSEATIPMDIFLQRSILGASLFNFFVAGTIYAVRTHLRPSGRQFVLNANHQYVMV